MTQEDVVNVLRTAFETPVKPARASGCGRAYVCVTADRPIVKLVAAACKTLGKLFNAKGHYGTGRNSIYIGYDNADGRALALAESVAEALKAAGISAYTDAVAD